MAPSIDERLTDEGATQDRDTDEGATQDGDTDERATGEGSMEDDRSRCPACRTPLFRRHCKFLCPNHGVVVDCSDPFTF